LYSALVMLVEGMTKVGEDCYRGGLGTGD